MGNECAPKLCRGQISETTAATVPRMPRPLRIDVPGGIYHVVTRGNRDDLIIHDDADRIGLLGFLTKAISRFGWICDAYCLMTTHYHPADPHAEGRALRRDAVLQRQLREMVQRQASTP
jgi:hypothetical protein